MDVTRVSYLPTANRKCPDCECTKAVPEAIARRDPVLCITPTAPCTRCDDHVEVSTAVLGTPRVQPLSLCEECGAEADLVRAEVYVGDGGTGYLHVCPECIALYDEAPVRATVSSSRAPALRVVGGRDG